MSQFVVVLTLATNEQKNDPPMITNTVDDHIVKALAKIRARTAVTGRTISIASDNKYSRKFINRNFFGIIYFQKEGFPSLKSILPHLRAALIQRSPGGSKYVLSYRVQSRFSLNRNVSRFYVDLEIEIFLNVFNPKHRSQIPGSFFLSWSLSIFSFFVFFYFTLFLYVLLCFCMFSMISSRMYSFPYTLPILGTFHYLIIVYTSSPSFGMTLSKMILYPDSIVFSLEIKTTLFPSLSILLILSYSVIVSSPFFSLISDYP